MSFGSKVAYIAFSTKSVIDSILAQSVSRIIRDNLYEFKSSLDELISVDKYLFLASDSTLTLLEVAFNPSNVRFEDVGVIIGDKE